MDWTTIKSLLTLKATELIAKAEVEGVRLLRETGKKWLGEAKREEVKRELLAFIELADNTIPGLDLPSVDAIEKTLVDEAINFAWDKIGSFINTLSKPVEEGEKPVVNAPEQAPGGLE